MNVLTAGKASETVALQTSVATLRETLVRNRVSGASCFIARLYLLPAWKISSLVGPLSSTPPEPKLQPLSVGSFTGEVSFLYLPTNFYGMCS